MTPGRRSASKRGWHPTAPSPLSTPVYAVSALLVTASLARRLHERAGSRPFLDLGRIGVRQHATRGARRRSTSRLAVCHCYLLAAHRQQFSGGTCEAAKTSQIPPWLPEAILADVKHPRTAVTAENPPTTTRDPHPENHPAADVLSTHRTASMNWAPLSSLRRSVDPSSTLPHDHLWFRQVDR